MQNDWKDEPASSKENWLKPIDKKVWTLTLGGYTSYADLVFNVLLNGYIDYTTASISNRVFPVLYLLTSTVVLTGNGTSQNTYLLVK